MKYIGIDLGSSFVKAVLLDLDRGCIVARKKTVSPDRESNSDPNYFEILAERLVETVQKLVDECTKEYKDIEGVIISTQMHGFIYSVPGKKDIYVSWQDMRCLEKMPGKEESYLEWLGKMISPKDMSRNGVYLKPSLGICNLYVLLDKHPELPRNGVLYTLGSYVIHALTGNNVCHISNAAPLGLADVITASWDWRLLKLLGFDEIELPRMAKSDWEVCGEYVSNDCNLKIFPDYGDMQVAILGSGIRDGDVVANVATGAQVIRYARDFVPGDYEIRPYFEQSYLYTISNMPSGRNLDVLIRFLQEVTEKIANKKVDIQDIWKKIHEEKIVSDEELKMRISFYKNPYFTNGGEIRGITQNNLHLGSIFYAAFEDMAKTYWDFIQKLGASSECIHRIVCAGGVNWRTPEIRQMLSKLSGKICELSPMADEAVNGMYQLSLMCSGKCKSLGECLNYSLKDR